VELRDAGMIETAVAGTIAPLVQNGQGVMTGLLRKIARKME
jgi:hypothetical protein